MELFYNPERMSETEIKETFVAHQWLVDEIVSILKRQPKGAGVQHVVIVAPRGMGKTTLLLMLRFTVLSQDIAKRWQPVLFPEESYSVYDLADLWMEVLDHIASETGDAVLREDVQKLRTNHPDSSELEDLTLARIKDWRVKNKKRLMLLVDNFDMILEQIGDEKDNASLRDVLMNDGTMMLIGGSTTFFKEARAYEQPLYNLFKIYNLDGLDSNQIEDLLRRRAKIDGVENFEEILRANRTRLRVLEYFTGGNPRLVLMLYRVITQSQIGEVRRGLEKLLDEVTPYYKAKIETLPPQQRKILDQIARISAQTGEGLTPTEIASATRLAVNQVSAQLKRLADDGYVRAANIRGRSSFYTLSEPLYAIWHQMRFSRDARMKMKWLVAFLKGWYDTRDLGTECKRLEKIFVSHLLAGRKNDARDVLEHQRYLIEAVDDQPVRARMLEGIILSYLALSDVKTLKRDVLTDVDIGALSGGTQHLLVATGIIGEDSRAKTVDLKTVLKFVRTAATEKNYVEAAEILQGMQKSLPENSAQRLMNHALVGFFLGNTKECLDNIEQFLKQMPELPMAWCVKGVALKTAARFEEAAEAFKRAIAISSQSEAIELLVQMLCDLGRAEEALAEVESVLQVNPNSFAAVYGRARTLAQLSRTKEALSTFDRAISLNPDSAEVWHYRGEILLVSGQIDEACKSFERAVELNPNSYKSLLGKYFALVENGRQDEALECVQTMLRHEPDSADAYFMRGIAARTKDAHRALEDLRYAVGLTSSSRRTMVDSVKGAALVVLVAVAAGELSNIKEDWNRFIQFAREEGGETVWLSEVVEVVRLIAQEGHWTLAQELITLSKLQQPLFPLERALEYLIGGDEAVIEKLSPEVRTIVRQVVRSIRKACADKSTRKKTTSSAKSKPKRRPTRVVDRHP